MGIKVKSKIVSVTESKVVPMVSFPFLTESWATSSRYFLCSHRLIWKFVLIYFWMSTIKRLIFFLISAKSSAMSLIWYERKARIPTIRDTKRITAIVDDKTFGNLNFVFKKWTIGNNNTAIKKAIKTGIRTLFPIWRI